MVCAVLAVGGLALVGSALAPRHRPIDATLDALLRPRSAHRAGGPQHGTRRLAARVGAPLATRLAASDPNRWGRLRADLAVMGETFDGHLGRSALCGAGGAGLAVGFAAMLWPSGVHLGAIPVFWVAVILAAAGAAAPTLTARSQAEERRRDMRAALAGVCDLCAVVLAGGDGIESALAAALGAGSGWAFAELRTAAAQARVVRQPPWAGIESLGERYRIDEAVELAGAIGLAGEEGARLRETLAAQAAALRRRATAGEEAKAGSVTERMSFPVAAVLVGFLLLIAYPALVRL
jgi:Flp pilus assembly protein TadB